MRPDPIVSDHPITKLPPGIAFGAFDGDQFQSRATRWRPSKNTGWSLLEPATIQEVVTQRPKLSSLSTPPLRGDGSARTYNRAPKGKPCKGAVRPVKGGTDRAHVLLAMARGDSTFQEIDAELKTRSSALAHAQCAWRDCGVGFEYDGQNRVRLLLPEGMGVEELIR